MRITKELCEVVGAIIGDGNLWTDGSRYRVEMTGDCKLDKKYFEYLANLEYRSFYRKPYNLRIKEGTVYMRLQSKQAFEALAGLGLHAGRGKALRVIIPESIVKNGWEYLRWTLRGIMDTDGTVFFSKKTYKTRIYPTLEISTSSKNLALQITKLLLDKGFRTKFRGYKRNAGNEEFQVALYGRKMLDKWISEIGFSNEKHINKLVPFYSIKLKMPQ